VILPRPTSLVLALALAVASTATTPRLAHADAPPTAAELTQAKKAYAEGKAKFDKGQYQDAVAKFKDSYRLSKNPLLLFNIALTFERLRTFDTALFYYKKFLSDAPADAAQRGDAESAVAALEKAGVTPSAGEDGATATPTAPAVEAPAKKKPAAACTEADVQHQIIEDAPPAKPLDLTAFVPAECGWTVTLFYRGAGDDKFVASPMKPRYNELVGRVPAAKMSGNAIQYYVEIKGADGALIKRIGKATSPNVVYLDEAATPRFYPDLDETGAATSATAEPDGGSASSTGDDEDPLAAKTAPRREPSGGGGGAFDSGAGATGQRDTGFVRSNTLKWTATGVGGGMLVLSVAFYGMASSWATSLENEAAASNDGECPDRGGPPCRSYDDARRDIAQTGARYETFSKITFAVGVVAGGVAGYLWYRDLKAKKKGDRAAAAPTGLRSLVASPAAGPDFIGGAAALRF